MRSPTALNEIMSEDEVNTYKPFGRRSSRPKVYLHVNKIITVLDDFKEGIRLSEEY